MKISRERLLDQAAATGFRPEILEKTILLLGLLERFFEHPFIQGRVALKGGTALNLFHFEVPRLSVDIDLNYIGAVERETMLEERPKLEEAIRAVCSREGFNIARSPTEHAGGKYRLRYVSALGQGGNLEVDVNYMLRVPLWSPQHLDSRSVGAYRAKGIPVIDLHELAAGKLSALLSRRASRDLYDAYELFSRVKLERKKLRFAFVVYGAMNRKDWRTVSVSDVDFDAAELRNQLLPTLREEYSQHIDDVDVWAGELIDSCRSGLGAVIPLSESETGFLDRLLDHGDIEPAMITDDSALAERLVNHPMIAWKAVNVRKHTS